MMWSCLAGERYIFGKEEGRTEKCGTPLLHFEGLIFGVLLRCPTSAFGDEAPWHLSTAATRSARFFCRRQRSHRSPRTDSRPICRRQIATSNGLATNLPKANCKELPPSRPAASKCPPGICIRLFESILGSKKRKAIQKDGFSFFGDLERTRTVDLQRDRLAC